MAVYDPATKWWGLQKQQTEAIAAIDKTELLRSTLAEKKAAAEAAQPALQAEHVQAELELQAAREERARKTADQAQQSQISNSSENEELKERVTALEEVVVQLTRGLESQESKIQQWTKKLESVIASLQRLHGEVCCCGY